MDYKIKEKLTPEIIRRDVKQTYAKEIKSYFVVALCFGFFAYMYKIIYSEYPAKIFKYSMFLFFLAALGFVAVGGYHIYCYFKPTYTVRIAGYKGLVSKTRIHFTGRHIRVTTYEYLHFTGQKPYSLEPNRIYYPWSKIYEMDGAGLANSSRRDDEFYIVMKNKRVVYVYNRKMFDFIDEQGNLIDVKAKNKF